MRVLKPHRQTHTCVGQTTRLMSLSCDDNKHSTFLLSHASQINIVLLRCINFICYVTHVVVYHFVYCDICDLWSHAYVQASINILSFKSALKSQLTGKFLVNRENGYWKWKNVHQHNVLYHQIVCFKGRQMKICISAWRKWIFTCIIINNTCIMVLNNILDILHWQQVWCHIRDKNSHSRVLLERFFLICDFFMKERLIHN